MPQTDAKRLVAEAEDAIDTAYCTRMGVDGTGNMLKARVALTALGNALEAAEREKLYPGVGSWIAEDVHRKKIAEERTRIVKRLREAKDEQQGVLNDCKSVVDRAIFRHAAAILDALADEIEGKE